MEKETATQVCIIKIRIVGNEDSFSWKYSMSVQNGSQNQLLEGRVAEAFKHLLCTSLVVQRIRIHLPMQGTQVQSLIQEDLTGSGATEPVCHNYLACNSRAQEPQPLNPCAVTTEALAPRACALQQETSLQ